MLCYEAVLKSVKFLCVAFYFGCLEMADNRYEARERNRRERRRQWQFDEDMRFNDEVDAIDRRVHEEKQKQREDLRRQHLLVNQ